MPVERERRNVYRVLMLCWLTYMAAYLCRVNLSTVLDKLSLGMGVSVEYLGIASSVYFVTYAVGQLLNGILGDRVNPGRFVMLALLATGGINVVLGIQSSGAAFLVLWSINGFFQSIFWSSLLRLLSLYAGEEDRKNVSTVMSTCSVTGYLVSWVGLAFWFRPFGYGPYFWVPGVLALLLIPAWEVLNRRCPIERIPAERTAAPPLRQVLREILRDRLAFLALLCLLLGAIQEGSVFWLPRIFQQTLGLGSESLFLLVLVPFAKLGGVFAARWLLGRLREDLRRAMRIVLTAACVISGVLLATSSSPSLVTALLIALLIAAINAGNWYLISYLPLQFSARNIVATLVGIFDFSTYIGAALVSGQMGVLLERLGLPALTITWLALSGAGLLLAFTGAGGCLERKGTPRC